VLVATTKPSTNIGGGGVGGAIGVDRDTGVIEIAVVPVDDVVVPVDDVVVPVDDVVVPVDDVVVPVDDVVVPVDDVVVPVDDVVVPVDDVVVPVDDVVVPVIVVGDGTVPMISEIFPLLSRNRNGACPSRKPAGTALGIVPPPCDATQKLNRHLQ